MRYEQIRHFDINNGPGSRVTIFVTGCRLHCEGCFNQELQSFNAGKSYDETAEKEILDALNNPHIRGLSVLGGEPLDQDIHMLHLLETVKKKYPNKEIWMWTGKTWEEIMASSMLHNMIEHVDVLVDGPFIQSLCTNDIRFRGSSNQRIINVQESLKKQEIVLVDEYMKKVCH